MKKALLTLFILGFVFVPCLLVEARERAVTQVSKTEIISEGLYFEVLDVCCSKNTITITVQAKNKSMFSQAVYVELTDETVSYEPLEASSSGLFSPLKFNKTITEKLKFNVGDVNKNYTLTIYSRDIFKKNKKQVITKMLLKDVKNSLNKSKSI